MTRKSFVLAALFSTVYSQNNLENCSRVDPSCGGTGEFVCIYRYVMDVSNTESSGYKNALQLDDDLAKGNENFKCYESSKVDALLATNQKKDSTTTVTNSYSKIEYIPPDVSECMVSCIDKSKYWCSDQNVESGKCCGELPSKRRLLEESQNSVEDDVCTAKSSTCSNSVDYLDKPKMFQYSLCPNKAAFNCGDREIAITENGQVSKQLVLKNNQLCSYILKSDAFTYKLKFKQVDNMKIHVTKKYLAPEQEKSDPEQDENVDKIEDNNSNTQGAEDSEVAQQDNNGRRILEEQNQEVQQDGESQQEVVKKYSYIYKTVEVKDQILEQNKDDVIYLSIWGTSDIIDGVLDFEIIDVKGIVVEEQKVENTEDKKETVENDKKEDTEDQKQTVENDQNESESKIIPRDAPEKTEQEQSWEYIKSWYPIWQEWYATIILVPVLIIGFCIFWCVYRSYVNSEVKQDEKSNSQAQDRKAKYHVSDDVQDNKSPQAQSNMQVNFEEEDVNGYTRKSKLQSKVPPIVMKDVENQNVNYLPSNISPRQNQGTVASPQINNNVVQNSGGAVVAAQQSNPFGQQNYNQDQLEFDDTKNPRSNQDLEYQNNIDVIDLVDSIEDSNVQLQIKKQASPYQSQIEISNQTPYEHEVELKRRGLRIEYENPANMHLLPTERFSSELGVDEKRPSTDRERKQVLERGLTQMIPSAQQKFKEQFKIQLKDMVRQQTQRNQTLKRRSTSTRK